MLPLLQEASSGHLTRILDDTVRNLYDSVVGPSVGDESLRERVVLGLLVESPGERYPNTVARSRDTGLNFLSENTVCLITFRSDDHLPAL